MRSAFAISARSSIILPSFQPHSGFSILPFPQLLCHVPVKVSPRICPFPITSSSSTSHPQFSSPGQVPGQMEMEELGDKPEVTVDELGKNISLRSNQRSPRDEAVLARFGKQQQLRVSPPPAVSLFHSIRRHILICPGSALC